MPSKLKTIEERFFQGSQDWSYEAFYDVDGTKLRIKIRRNAYDEQSYAHCEVLDRQERKWNMLVTIHISQMKCRPVSYVMRDLEPRYKQMFKDDAAELLRLAKELLS